MKRRNAEQVGDVVGLFLRESGLETPLLQYRLVQLWAEVVGQHIAHRTEALKVENQTLWVRVHTPALRTQLSMNRQQLVRRLNETLKSIIIYDIKFI